MPPPRLGLACERAVLLCPLPSAPATVRITRRQCREQSSEPIVRNYQGRQGAVRRATEPLTQLRSSALSSAVPSVCLWNTGTLSRGLQQTRSPIP